MVNCRSCRSELKLTLIDLGSSPIANNLIPNTQSMKEISYFPLCAKICENCSLVQLSEELPRETLFRSDYVYHSSYSSSWLEHSRSYVRKMVKFLNLSENDLVVEVASNDGYLLKFNFSKFSIVSSCVEKEFINTKGTCIWYLFLNASI